MVKKGGAKKKAPGKRARTPRLPGTEDGAIAEIEKAAEAYEDARDERMRMTGEEKEAKDKLLKVMEKHKRKRYVFDNKEVEVEEEPGTKTVKVRKLKKTDGEEEAGEAEK
jgi:hypothetical protein